LLVAGGLIKLNDLETGKQRDFLGNNPQTRQTNLFNGRFTADGQRLYLSGYRNKPQGQLERADGLWEVASGKLVEEVHAFPERPFGFLMMAPDERYFIFGIPNETIIRVWDGTARREATPLEATAVPTGLAFSPDGQFLVTGYGDGMMRLWDYKNGKQLAEFEANREDEHLPAGKDDARFPAPLLTARAVRGLAFSTDGKRLVTGKSNGFKVWDAAKVFGREFAQAPVAVKPPAPGLPAPAKQAEGIREVATFQAHGKDITGMALAPDGSALATAACQDLFAAEAGEIKLWNLDGRKEIAHAAGDGLGRFTPDGKHLLCVMHTNAL